MQHVVLIMLARHVSGAEHQTLALARYLGLERRVTLLANDELAGLLAGDPFLRRYCAGLAVQRLGPAFPEQPARSLRGALSRGRLYLRLQRALGRALRALRPDVVHLVLAPTFFAYAPHFRRLPYPLVITLAGEMRYVRHFYGAGKRLAVRHAAARADALVVCSADEMVNLAAVAPQAVSRATLIDNFTDVARFAPAAQKEPLVAFAARLHPEKGALLFVEAAARVRATHPAARFALMGRGEEDAAVAARLSALGLRDAVRRDYATDLAPLFARASVFVSCQRHENLGSSSLLEAMASGDAVVATDVGQTWRIVDERVGRRVAPSPEALAAAVGAMLDDPQGTAVLGAAARERVLAGYGPGPYVARLLSVYEQAAQRRAGAII